MIVGVEDEDGVKVVMTALANGRAEGSARGQGAGALQAMQEEAGCDLNLATTNVVRLERTNLNRQATI